MRYPTPTAIVVLASLLLLGSCGGSGDGEQPGADPGLREIVAESTAERFRASVLFGAPRFTQKAMDGEMFTMVGLDGCRPGGTNDGMPGVPILTRLLAVPRGARVVISDVQPVVSETRSLLLYPYQAQAGDYSPAYELPEPAPPEAETWAPPFAYARDAYAGSMAHPPDPIHVSPIFPARDVSLCVLQIAAGRYVPATQELMLYASVEFTLLFEGGDGMFLRNGAGNPFEEGSRTAVGAAWNHAAVEQASVFDPPTYIQYGEELLILTHPDYREAADRLAVHKNGRGLVTSVVTVNDGAGAGGPDTKEEIKAFLDDRYDSTLIRFSYLLLLGDADDIEPWVLPRRYKAGDFPSDFPYAQIDTDPMDDDLGPEIAVGRVAVGSLAEANVVVDKIIDYEASPPSVLPGGTFYRHAAIASYFQPGEGGAPPNVENYRRFVFDSEAVRGHLVNRGFDVERIYTAHHPLTEETTPRYYKDGVTPLPAPLRPEDDYPWDGDADAIIDAFNAGKTLFFHADHGGWNGWGHPIFHTTHLPSLTNGDLLPLVLSDNCSSGAFDYSSQGFAESILRMSGGGAIGVIAFTRNSNNGVGWQFLAGVVDSIWPDAWPTLGDDQERRRLGDMLNHARYVMTVNHAGGSPTDDGYLGAWCYARMLTLFGDPTLEVWVENPNPLPMLGDDFVDGPALELVYPYAGATITVFEELPDGTVPIGRGVAGADGMVSIDPLVTPTDVSRLRFFATAPGAIATPVDVATGVK